MDDEQDVKRMTEFINSQKSGYQSNFQLEFQDFINFKHDSDQESDDCDFSDPDEPPDYKLNFETLTDLTFTEEEQIVLNTCPDPTLKKLMVLNRSKHIQLMKIHKKLQDVISQCDEEIEEKRALMKTFQTKQLSQQTFVWKLAAPYFKDKKFFPCPLNDDALKKRSQNELSVYDLVPSPKWLPIEFDRLTNAVKCNYNINRQNDIVSKIKSLKNKLQDDCDDGIIAEIAKLNEQLEKVKNDEEIPPLDSNEFVDWYKVAEVFLKDKHTAQECQSVWRMLIHPEINKSEWSEEENTKLEQLAKNYNYQNWDQIAIELNTNRTGFMTCLQYFSKLCDKFKKSKFTPEEDKFLLEVIETYKIGNFIPWNKVVCHISNRSRHQLYHRYTYFLSQNHVKKGKFSEAEDILLIILVNKFGRNFKKCAEYMPHRSQVQLKSRYNSNLQRHIKKGTFTTEDDQIIYEYAQKYGEKSWSGLTERLKRCNAQIRQRYKLIKTFLQENPNCTIADIPKRRHRFDEMDETQFNFLNYIADQYKDESFIPTLSMIKESLQESMNIRQLSENKFKNIDEMLTDFFRNSVRIRPEMVITESSLTEAAENTQEVLKLLNVDLKIPNDLEYNGNFDNIDLEILERISGKKQNAVSSKICPPNYSTLVGLKNLILKHKEYKQSCTKVKNRITIELNSAVLKHRNCFTQRFNSLFYWSGVLSLEKPNIESNKRMINGNCPEPKKRKIDVAELGLSLKKYPQIKLVDKSVVDNLIKRNQSNVIKIDSVVEKPTESQDNVISVEDFQDVERLNVILKNIKSETDNSEYKSLKDDVQLLNEILKYDKVIKSDPEVL